ncbi:MAG: copper amine oxidase N-terminal domain-containing protein, partial [Anaerotignum sp.]|nr:copper amine oxidase N-terminal domain-containing protein [Anaerotignum sp.]
STLKCKGFLNKGTLNIMNGTLICDEFAYSAIESTGTLNVTDVDVTAARHAIRVEGGTAVIDGGTYKTGTVGKTTHAVNVSDGGEVIIKDGTFVGPAAVTGTDSGSAVNCQKDSKVTIENGKFSSGKRNTLAAAGNLIVKGGYFDQDPAAYVAEGYKVKDNDDATYLYKVTGYSTNIGHGFQTIISDDREAITTTLEDVYAKDSLVVKIYSGNTLLGTTTLKAVDDEGNAMYPATGEYTVNNVINGRESGSWDTVWNVELTRKNVPTKIEVYADGKLTDTYTDADGCFLDEENKTAYVGLFPEIVDVPSSPSGNGGGSTSKKYSVEIDEDIENGSIKLDRTKAKSGTEVTITATPDKGYKLDELKVLNSRGTEIDLEDNGDGTFTFKMPKGGVDIEASFVEGEAESEAPAGEKESLVLTINQVIYQLNGSYAANDVAPIIKGDRTMLPIRLIAEFLGATVTWNEAEQSVTIVKDDTTIVIYIDQAFAMVNGEPVQLDAPAFIANDRTYLPLRFIAENLGAEVVWNGANNTVTIYK